MNNNRRLSIAFSHPRQPFESISKVVARIPCFIRNNTSMTLIEAITSSCLNGQKRLIYTPNLCLVLSAKNKYVSIRLVPDDAARYIFRPEYMHRKGPSRMQL